MLKLNKLQVGHTGDVANLSLQGDGNMPQGGNTYTVNRWGRITSATGCNGRAHDVVVIGPASYRCEKPLAAGNYSYGHDQEGTQIENGDYGLFKFLADHTDVEWGAMYSGGLNPSDSTACLLQTSHENGVCNTSFCWSDYDTFVHSHPRDGAKQPTHSDEEAKKEMLNDTQCKVSDFGVYLTASRTVKAF